MWKNKIGVTLVLFSILCISVPVDGLVTNAEYEKLYLEGYSSLYRDIQLVEKYLEDSLRGGENSFYEDFQILQPIIGQLGWVYNTSKYVISLSIKGITLYRLLSSKYKMLTTWHNSFMSMKEQWQIFKTTPSISNLLQFTSSLRTLFRLTIPILLDLADGKWEIVLLLQSFLFELRDFIVFLQGEPWNEPILIVGTVKGLRGGRAIVSCKNESTTTDGSYTLIYTTVDEPEPWALHQCVVTATYKGVTKTKDKYAFSMGKIRIDFDFSERVDKSNGF